jgi:hypothetical protein
MFRRPELVPIENPLGSAFGWVGFRVELVPVEARTLGFYKWIKRKRSKKHNKV